MKTTLIITILFLGLNSMSQDTLVDSRSQLELIADELDISEKEAYQSLVREQQVQAYRNLMIFFTMFIGMAGMRKSIKKMNNDKHELTRYGSKELRYKDSHVFLTFLFSTIFVASVIYNSIMLGDTFTGLFNPEYGALEQLKFIGK